VHLTLRPDHKPWRLQGLERASIHEVDLADAAGVSKAAAAIRPEWVFHLAAHGAYPDQRDWGEIARSNFTGTVNLVQACLESGFESFVNTGSSSEYGFKDHAPTESEALEPSSEYAVTKAAATLYCGFIARSRDVRIRTLRLYSVYGPWEEPTRLIPTMIVSGLRHRLPALADPRVARDFVYVDDVCDVYLATAADTNAAADAIFNVGSGVQSSLEEVVGLARRVMGVDAEPVWGSMPNRRWDTSTWVANIARLSHELGWAPRHSLESGFAATVEWLRADPARQAFYEERSPLTSST
jgi:nucleoside-diphosphate-sugar epimerase